jgi:hypothetical protein
LQRCNEIQCCNEITELIVRKLLLAAAFASALTSGALAQTPDSSVPPRDPPFGKAALGNDTMHLPSSAGTRSAAVDGASKSEAPKVAKTKNTTKSAAKKDKMKTESAPTGDATKTDMN